MIKESTAHESGSVSNDAPESKNMIVSPGTRLSMTRSLSYQCATLVGTNPEDSVRRNRSSKSDELVSHLLNFSHALSFEMARYLDMLSFSGKAYADEVAAEQNWQIDYEIVEQYRAGMRAIAAKYAHRSTGG
jgi:hypothetical protein